MAGPRAQDDNENGELNVETVIRSRDAFAERPRNFWSGLSDLKCSRSTSSTQIISNFSLFSEQFPYGGRESTRGEKKVW
jgi:hypothetical protein